MPDQSQNVRILRFTGMVSKAGRANGLPPRIFAYIFYNAAMSVDQVTEMIEKQFAVYRALGGMSVEKNQGAVIDMRRTIMDRILVPMQWLVYIHPDIVPIPGDTPMADEHGVERFSDGKEPLKN